MVNPTQSDSDLAQNPTPDSPERSPNLEPKILPPSKENNTEPNHVESESVVNPIFSTENSSHEDQRKKSTSLESIKEADETKDISGEINLDDDKAEISFNANSVELQSNGITNLISEVGALSTDFDEPEDTTPGNTQTPDVEEAVEKVSNETRASKSASTPIKASLSSLVFVVSSMKKLSNTRDATKSIKPFLKKGLALLEDKIKENNEGEEKHLSWGEVNTLMEGLDLMTDPSKNSSTTVVLVLDVIEKLVSFKYLKNLQSSMPKLQEPKQSGDQSPSNGPEKKSSNKKAWKSPLTDFSDRLIKISCRGFTGSSTPTELQLQIVKTILTMVLSQDLKIHQDSLLRAVRTVVNIYLLGFNSQNEAISQAALSQIVNIICQRARSYSLDNTSDRDVAIENDTAVVNKGRLDEPEESSSVNPPMSDEDLLNDIEARDVFLVFWALSKLSMRKPDDVYSDLKKFTERSRIIALSMMNLMLKDYHDVFTNSFLFIKSAAYDYESSLNLSTSSGVSRSASSNKQASFGLSEPPGEKEDDYSLDTAKDVDGASQELQAAVENVLKQTPELSKNENGDNLSLNTEKQNYYTVPLAIVIKQYLSLSLSRNLVSTNLNVLSISLQIFELILIYLRRYLKQEIEVLMKEIIFPILSMKHTGSLPQRILLMRMLCQVLLNPSLVVELYLNYDCDTNSQVQIFQQLTEQLCRTSTIKVDFHSSSGGSGMWEAWANMSSSQQDAVEDNLWKMVQDVKSVFRPGSSVFISGSDETSIGDTDTFINSSLSFDDMASPSDITIDQGVVNMNISADDGNRRKTFSHRRPSNSVSGINSDTKSKVALNAESDEYILRQLALNALCYLLQSMVIWSNQQTGTGLDDEQTDSSDINLSIGSGKASEDFDETKAARKPQSFSKVSMSRSSSHHTRQIGVNVIQPQDDANLLQLQANKQRKEKFAKAIAMFNWKPKKGIKEFINEGFIPSESPQDVANFLVKLSREGTLNKAVLGEYLGEGDSYNIDVMHKYVDILHFRKMSFTDALRLFLQGFRLPGEGQKIDRFMLKFAERYVDDNKDEEIFANADAAYVLAYSTIMLNTDQHSMQVKDRMTKDEFVQNNRGINNGQNIKQEFLETIFDEISANEIKLKDDPLGDKNLNAGFANDSGDGSSFFLELWRRRQNEGKILHTMNEHSAKMANKSEQKIKAITKIQEKKNGSSKFWFLEESKYTKATRIEHVSSMFAAVWPPVLAALSLPLQTTRDPRAIIACLIALQSCITLSCRFKLTLERAAFVTSLSKFTILGSLSDIGHKQAEATRALLEIPLVGPDAGDGFEEDWIYILQCISLLDRLRLLLDPVPVPVSSLPSGKSVAGSEKSFDSNRSENHKVSGSPTLRAARQPVRRSPSTNMHPNNYIYELSKQKFTKSKLSKLEPYFHTLDIAVDKIFSSSVLLSGKGIVDFVRALTYVAFEEIDFSFTSSNVNPMLSSIGNSSHIYKNKNVVLTKPTNLINETHPSDSQDPNVRRDSLQEENEDLERENNPNFDTRVSMDRSRTTSSLHQTMFGTNNISKSLYTNSSSALDNTPRLYMLTRIVEIVYYNMNRIKFEWSHIWAVLGDLFDRAGSYPDTRVAEYTLDSLRQLSTKFLELDELSHFQFQKQFLRPFVTVLEYQSNLTGVSDGQTINMGDRFVKDMVLKCIKQLVETKSQQLKSGWRSVLTIAQIAALDYDDKIAELGFELARISSESIMLSVLSHPTTVDSSENEKFCELINCLSAFALHANRPRLALQAVELISHTSSFITVLDQKTKKPIEPMSIYLKMLLKSLHQVVLSSEDLEIRSLALDKCYSVARAKAKELTLELWSFFFKDIGFALFSDIQDGYLLSSKYTNSDDIELWVSTTLVKALRLMIGLFIYNFENSIDISDYFDNLLNLLQACICQQNETLSRIGAASLQDFIEKSYIYLSLDSRSKIIKLLAELLRFSQPEFLFEIGSKLQHTATKANTSDDLYFKITLKCVLQLQLINSIADVFVSNSFSLYQDQPNNQNALAGAHSDVSRKKPNSELFGLDMAEVFVTSSTITYFSNEDLLLLCDSLNQSRIFASKFNYNLAVRRRLVERGITPQLPSLLKQETSSSLIMMLLLEKMYFYYLNPDVLLLDPTKPISPEFSKISKKSISGYLENIESQLSVLFLTILASYNFSSTTLLGSNIKVRSFIPWPRSFGDNERFDLKICTNDATRLTGQKKEHKSQPDAKEPALPIETSENAQTEPAVSDNVPAEAQPASESQEKAPGEESAGQGVAQIPNNPMASSTSHQESAQKNQDMPAPSEKVARSVMDSPASRTDYLEVQPVGSEAKPNTPEPENSSGAKLSSVGDAISISDNHRLAWRRSIFAMISFLGRVYLQDRARFKRLNKSIHNEVIKALSTAFNSGDSSILAHIQFLLACVSSAYDISEQSLSFV